MSDPSAGISGEGGRSREVIWGWRRSTWDDAVSRLVYFAADREVLHASARLHRPRLVLVRRGRDLKGIRERALRIEGGHVDFSDHDLTVSLGPVGDDDRRRIERLDRSRRHTAKDRSQTRQTYAWRTRLREIGRNKPHLLVYVGSGLSYDAGIPTLASMHQLFGVDEGTNFCLGNSDPLIDNLAAHSFARFVEQVQRFHSICASAPPSSSHRHLESAYRRGEVSLVLTDNVDDIFERQMKIPTLRTRGDGLVSEKYPGIDDVLNMIKKSPHALLVVGVSADRRGIIESCASVAPTIVVNPGLRVSPHSKNLDYLDLLGFDKKGRSPLGHVFIKQPAQKCLSEILSILR
jgi:hypothetical protein